MKVIKRDGSIVEFDKSKIREAVTKAMKNGSGIYLGDIAKLIANDAENTLTKKKKCQQYIKLNHMYMID